MKRRAFRVVAFLVCGEIAGQLSRYFNQKADTA